MIPFALIGIIVLGVVTIWVFHLVAGLREAVRKFDRLEEQVEALRDSLDTLLIGDIPREDIRALLRRHFDRKRG